MPVVARPQWRVVRARGDFRSSATLAQPTVRIPHLCISSRFELDSLVGDMAVRLAARSSLSIRARSHRSLDRRQCDAYSGVSPVSRVSTAERIWRGRSRQWRRAEATAGGTSAGRRLPGTHSAHRWCSRERRFCPDSVSVCAESGGVSSGPVSTSVRFCSGPVPEVFWFCNPLFSCRLQIRFPPPPQVSRLLLNELGKYLFADANAASLAAGP